MPASSLPRTPLIRRPQGPGRPKDLEKKAAILDAAKKLFPLRGFEGVSMEAIAAEAGVSKLTVYNHFTDKETLFSAAVKQRCEELLPHEVFEVDVSSRPIAELLGAIGRAFHALVTSDEAVQLQRILAARAMTDTRLAQLFYEAGPKRTLTDMDDFLRRANAAKVLDVPDTARAAAHFCCLIKGEQHLRMMVGCCEGLSARECRAHIDSVVDMFLRAYAPR